MFGKLKRAFGIVTASTKGDVISVSGLPADTITGYIRQLWATNAIAKYMFNELKSSDLSFFTFFLVEMLYLIETVRDNAKSMFLKRNLDNLLEILKENTWIKPLYDETAERPDDILDFSQLSKLRKDVLKGGDLLPSQHAFLKQYNRLVPIMRLRGYMLASPPGSGKTLTGLALGLCLKADAVIIVCPKNAVAEVWVKNIAMFLHGDPKVWTSTSGAELTANYDYYICHYEQLGTLVANPAVFTNRKVLIDLDECHNFNDPNSARTALFIELCRMTNCQNVLWASGTPLKSIGKEMIGFLRTVDPFFTPQVEERFKGIFGLNKGKAGDILSHRMGIVSYRVSKSEIMADEPIVEEIKIKMPGAEKYTLENLKREMVAYVESRFAFYKEHRQEYVATYNRGLKHYEEMVYLSGPKLLEYERYKRYVNIISKTATYDHVTEEIKFTNKYEKELIIPTLKDVDKEKFRKAKGVVKYVPLVIRGEALGSILGKRRMECIRDMLPHVPLQDIIEAGEKKTLIFTSYVDVVRECEKKVTNEGFSPLLVFGETNANLKNIIHKFDTQPQLNPLIATLQSLSTAVPVISANVVVFLNAPFRIHERDQAISRVHRLGQDRTTYVFDIVLDTGGVPNISTRSKDIMEWSKEQVDLIMGTGGNVSIEEYVTRDMGLEHFVDYDKIERVVKNSTSW